jgi:2-polyprenyl-3-methyl-5-hydroxy-6-metoxy-1,4-benzoquinol methylase
VTRLAERLPEPVLRVARPVVHPVFVARARVRAALPRLRERIVWGGPRRERLLLRALGGHYQSVRRRQWVLSDEAPHFFDHRHGAYDLLAGTGHPYAFLRGYLAGELVRPGDRVLDIGCGDGFFARRFFAARGAEVDAIDVEPDAIRHAEAHNAHPYVRYLLMDAVAEPFPAARYDVVVWDGAIGHFPLETTEVMLAKIAGVLADDGVFAGSESLGQEGHDHLQFFPSADALAELLRARFRHVDVRTLEYALPDGRVRREAYWRCAQEPSRLDAAGWARGAG